MSWVLCVEPPGWSVGGTQGSCSTGVSSSGPGAACCGVCSWVLLSSQGPPTQDSGTDAVESFAWQCFEPRRKGDEWVT